MVLLEEDIRRMERIDNAPERKRKAGRKETAEKNGANYIVTALQRFTVRTLKFIRWLRNFVCRETSWEAAMARLRRVCAIFLGGVFYTNDFVPMNFAAGERH